MAKNQATSRVFEVEKVIGRRINYITGKAEYLLKWKGYPE